MRTLICAPVDCDGPILIPDVGLFAAGPVEVDEATAEKLLRSPHFRAAPAPKAPKPKP